MSQQENHPGFFAVIPATVRYCKSLEPSAKLLYGEITALCSKEGYCWAKNQYLADLYQVDERTIRRWLESLSREGFIKIEITKNGFNTLRKIYIVKEMFTMGQKCPSREDKKGHVPPDENALHINTMNNTSSSSKPPQKMEVPKPAVKQKGGGGNLKDPNEEKIVKLANDCVEQSKSKGINLDFNFFYHHIKNFGIDIIDKAMQEFRSQKRSSILNLKAWLINKFKQLQESEEARKRYEPRNKNS